MRVTDDITNVGTETRITLDMSLDEAETLRAWLLKASVDGTTSLDDPYVNGVLGQLGRSVDSVRVVANVRLELAHAGLDVAHLSDEQVRELGRRVSEAALPGVRA